MESIKQILNAMPARIDSTQDAIAVREWWKDAEVVIRSVDAGIADRFAFLEIATYPVSPFRNPAITEQERADIIAFNPNDAQTLADFDNEKQAYQVEAAQKLGELKSELVAVLSAQK